MADDDYSKFVDNGHTHLNRTATFVFLHSDDPDKIDDDKIDQTHFSRVVMVGTASALIMIYFLKFAVLFF